MVFKFLYPFYLIGIPVGIIIFLVITLLNKNSISKFQKYFTLVIRCLFFILLILSMSGYGIRKYIDETTTIFTVDLSASFKGNKDRALQFIKDSIKNKNDNDSVGIVCFGENGSIEFMPDTDKGFEDLNSFVNQDYTNISSALNVASAIIPEDSHKRIVLISDGMENIDSAELTAKALKNRGIEISSYYIKSEIEKEVQLTELKVPKIVNKDLKYDIEVGIYSLEETESKLIIYRNNEIIANQNVVVRQGNNKYVFSDMASQGGVQTYRAEIQPLEDTYSENNILYSYSYIEDTPNILVVGKDDSASQIVEILQSSNVNITNIQPKEAPTSVENINKFKAIVMADVSIDDLPQGFESILESYVKNIGGGLVVTGGENSYALGGYKDTVLEDILPVDMMLKDEEEKADLALLVIVDRSGSMSSGNFGISKLELAKEAVIRAAEALEDDDSIGVLAFDTENDWSVETQKIDGNIDSITSDISRISPGGGTSILPALNEGFNILKDYDAKTKHIILLTDGQAEQSGYDGLIKSMVDNSITLSSIAVGSDADRSLLQKISEQGLGRYYFTDEFTDLPKIFLKETLLAGETFLNNETFVPSMGKMSPIISDIEQLPELDGYISTTAKARADVILSSYKEEPVLASWQYGLGRSIAWTSDMNNKWSSKWLSSSEGVEIFKNTVSWALSKDIGLNVEVNVIQKGRDSEIYLDIPFSEGVKAIKGMAIATGENKIPLNFEMIAPGSYKATMNSVNEGIYIANLEIEKDSKTENMNIGINIPYSKEYDIQNHKSGEELLKKIANESNGKIIEKPEEVFLSFDNDVFGESDLSNILLICAGVIFLFDIILRRFTIILSSFEKLILKLRLKTVNNSKDIKKKEENDESKLLGKIKKDKIKEKKPNDNEKTDTDSKSYSSDELLKRMRKRKGD